MSTCKGCGGTVGRDCFNPQECEWISNEQQRRANNHGSDQRITDLETALRAAQATIGELAMEVARLTVAPGCVARLTVALQAAQRGPVAEKAGDLSPVYSWLEKVARTGIAEVDNAALTMMAFYQGGEFPASPTAADAGGLYPCKLGGGCTCATEDAGIGDGCMYYRATIATKTGSQA